MAFLQETSHEGKEGIVSSNENIVDLSEFKDVESGLKALKMYKKYFESFKTNNVNDAALPCLEKDDLKELIPAIGDRARFNTWLVTYKNDHGQSNNINNNSNETVDCKQPCSVCNGTKQVKQTETYIANGQCTTCGGQGGTRGKWETATVGCNGTYGRCDGGFYYCQGCPDRCGWKGPGTCSYCPGYRKQYTCSDCNGRGTVQKQQFNNSHWNPCNQCGGKGTISQNQTREKMVRCSACD
eukprot:90508_1